MHFVGHNTVFVDVPTRGGHRRENGGVTCTKAMRFLKLVFVLQHLPAAMLLHEFCSASYPFIGSLAILGKFGATCQVLNSLGARQTAMTCCQHSRSSIGFNIPIPKSQIELSLSMLAH